MADMIDLDNILEDDLMDALSDLGIMATSSPKVENSISNIDDITIPEPIIEEIKKVETQNINISSFSSDIDNIAHLLKELLNNKTIEITIKIKDN
ncbi:MAG: hypothetical protein KAJ49_02215 [Arcobacteraceae bacterium]|nr:hypothetical protein [Arcobacteraceae bacterium]